MIERQKKNTLLRIINVSSDAGFKEKQKQKQKTRAKTKTNKRVEQVKDAQWGTVKSHAKRRNWSWWVIHVLYIYICIHIYLYTIPWALKTSPWRAVLAIWTQRTMNSVIREPLQAAGIGVYGAWNHTRESFEEQTVANQPGINITWELEELSHRLRSGKAVRHNKGEKNN